MNVTVNHDGAVGGRAMYGSLIVIAGLVVVLDFTIKAWVRSRFGGFLESADIGPNVTIAIKDNPGGAFGLLQGADRTLNRVLFSMVSLVAIASVIWLYRTLRPRRPALTWGLPLVLGGAVGNLLDRVRFGHVLDFVEVHVLIRGVRRHAPYFNAADVAITIGVALMAIEVLRRRPRAEGAAAVQGDIHVDGGATPLGPGDGESSRV
jgi:signal peptidase II